MSAPPSLTGDPQPTVSVVIPAYNYIRFLPEAIDSALGQTLPPFEVLVIDDGSTDNTAEVVAARYGQNPCVRYIHQANAGLSATRNTGIRHARGEFIAFLDADDLWKPDFLKNVLTLFAGLSPGFGLIGTRGTIVSSDRSILPRKQLLADTGRELSVADILLKTRFSPSAAVCRREVFAACGDFDTTLRSSEDRDMWIRVAARHRVYLSGEQLLIFRRHAQSMSTHADRMKANVRRTFEKARANPHIKNLPPLFWWKVFSFYHFQTAWMYFEEGRRGQALADLLRSLIEWPWFAQSYHLNEPQWFRLRSLKHFLTAPNPRRAA